MRYLKLAIVSISIFSLCLLSPSTSKIETNTSNSNKVDSKMNLSHKNNTDNPSDKNMQKNSDGSIETTIENNYTPSNKAIPIPSPKDDIKNYPTYLVQ